MSPRDLALVAALGAAGSVLRVVAVGLLDRRAPRGFPVGVLAVNVAGALAAGVVAAALEGELRLALAVGLLGALTTFSTLAVDVVLLAERGRHRAAALDLALSLALGLAAAALGVAIGGLA